MHISWSVGKLRLASTNRWSCAQWRWNEFESGGHQSRGKVGGTDPEEKWGAPIRRQAPEKFFLVVPLQCLALKAQLVVLVSAFVMASTVWSVYCLLFFYSRCTRAPWSRRHWMCYIWRQTLCTMSAKHLQKSNWLHYQLLCLAASASKQTLRVCQIFTVVESNVTSVVYAPMVTQEPEFHTVN